MKGEEGRALICCTIHAHQGIHRGQLIDRCRPYNWEWLTAMDKGISPVLPLPLLHRQLGWDRFGMVGFSSLVGPCLCRGLFENVPKVPSEPQQMLYYTQNSKTGFLSPVYKPVIRQFKINSAHQNERFQH